MAGIHRDTRDILSTIDRIERGRVCLSCQDRETPAIQDRQTIDDIPVAEGLRRFMSRQKKHLAMIGQG
jgi:hypothetical protein